MYEDIFDDDEDANNNTTKEQSNHHLNDSLQFDTQAMPNREDSLRESIDFQNTMKTTGGESFYQESLDLGGYSSRSSNLHVDSIDFNTMNSSRREEIRTPISAIHKDSLDFNDSIRHTSPVHIDDDNEQVQIEEKKQSPIILSDGEDDNVNTTTTTKDKPVKNLMDDEDDELISDQAILQSQRKKKATQTTISDHFSSPKKKLTLKRKQPPPSNDEEPQRLNKKKKLSEDNNDDELISEDVTSTKSFNSISSSKQKAIEKATAERTKHLPNIFDVAESIDPKPVKNKTKQPVEIAMVRPKRYDTDNEHEISFEDSEDYREQIGEPDDGYVTPDEKPYKKGGYALRVTPTRKRKSILQKEDDESPVIEISDSDHEHPTKSSKGKSRLIKRRNLIVTQNSDIQSSAEEDESDKVEEEAPKPDPEEVKNKIQKRKEAMKKLVQIHGKKDKKSSASKKHNHEDDSFTFHEDLESPVSRSKAKRSLINPDTNSLEDFLVADDVPLTQYTDEEYYGNQPSSSEEEEEEETPVEPTQMNIEFDDEETQYVSKKSDPVKKKSSPSNKQSTQLSQDSFGLKDPFKIGVQYILSCLLEEGAEEYFKRSEDSYFQPALHKIYSKLEAAIFDNSLVSNTDGSTSEVIAAIHRYPVFRIYETDSTECALCKKHDHESVFEVELSGTPISRKYYEIHSNTEVLFSKKQEDPKKFIIGDVCLQKLIVYHMLHHYKYFLVKRLTVLTRGSTAAETTIQEFLPSQKLSDLYNGYTVLLKTAEYIDFKVGKDSYKNLLSLVFPVPSTSTRPSSDDEIKTTSPKKKQVQEKKKNTKKEKSHKPLYNKIEFVKKASVREEQKTRLKKKSQSHSRISSDEETTTILEDSPKKINNKRRRESSDAEERPSKQQKVYHNIDQQQKEEEPVEEETKSDEENNNKPYIEIPEEDDLLDEKLY
jgi:hypothetical protein